MEIRQEVLDNAIEIWDGINVQNITPYMPANGTEGDIFESRWCCNCDFTPHPNIGECSILTNAYCGIQPNEWIYYDNKPICTAFKKGREDEEDVNDRYVRGQATREEIEEWELGL